MAKKTKSKLTVETLTHDGATRKNIPTAELQSVMSMHDLGKKSASFQRCLDRNRDLDPQLVWRGKDEQDWSDLVVHAPPLYIQEKVHPKVLIDDLRRHCTPASERGGVRAPGEQTRSTSSPTSTACPTTTPRPSSTSTTPIGPTA